MEVAAAIRLTTLRASNFPLTVSTQADSGHSWPLAPLLQLSSVSMLHKDRECLPNRISSSFAM